MSLPFLSFERPKARSADHGVCLVAVLPGEGSLAIRVSSVGTADATTWYDIYAGLTTVWTMCGVRGRAGIAMGIGISPISER